METTHLSLKAIVALFAISFIMFLSGQQSFHSFGSSLTNPTGNVVTFVEDYDDIDAPYMVTEITRVVMDTGALPLSSPLEFYYYDDENNKLSPYYFGTIATDGTYAQSSYVAPSEPKALLVGVSAADWDEIDGWPYPMIDSDNEDEPNDFYLFIKKVTNDDVGESLPGYLVFYVGRSGSTYYASESHDFVVGTAIMSPEEALREEHIAQENPW